MMTFCGSCNKWVQASSIAQPFGTPYVCGHADGAVALEAPQQELGTWTTLVHRPAGYGAKYTMADYEPGYRQALEQMNATYVQPVDTQESLEQLSPLQPVPSIATSDTVAPIADDLVRCRSCQKGYRWPMEASRTDEYHLCLRCEYKQ
jgi:hypothetical protein